MTRKQKERLWDEEVLGYADRRVWFAMDVPRLNKIFSEIDGSIIDDRKYTDRPACMDHLWDTEHVVRAVKLILENAASRLFEKELR
jgi:hypothetical protein